MTVNICGIPHEVVEHDDVFDANEIHFGQINYKTCRISISKGMTEEMKNQALCHEMLHGILVHLGYNEQSADEQFVQALASAINQSFEVRRVTDERDCN